MLMLQLALVIGAAFPVPQAGGAALFNKGVTWEEFQNAVDARRDQWRANTRQARQALKPEMVERLKAAGAGLTLLVVAEANCSDSVNTIPYIAELAARAGIDLRIVGREAGASVLERYRTPDGRAATPTVVLLRGGRDVGAWIERPAALQTWFISMAGIPTSERLERKMAWYEWDRGDSTLSDFLAAVEQASAGRP